MTEREIVIADISSYVGDIDYDEFCKHVDGVIMRAQNGHYGPDAKFPKHWKEFGVREKPRGTYNLHYLLESDKDNKRQAELALQTLEGNKAMEPELKHWGDWERDNANLNVNDGRDAIWKYINVFESGTGEKLGGYTSAGFWNANVANSVNGNTDIPKDRMLWVANYTTAKSPIIPYDWEKRFGKDCWVLWQYTSKAKIPGCKASVDLNRFNGSKETFEKIFGLKLDAAPDPVKPPPPPPAEKPKKIRIVGLQGAETLRMRDAIWGDTQAFTWNDRVFTVLEQGKDVQNRVWYQIAPELWVASWYTDPVA